MSDYIKYKQFKKLLTSQPFFIWHTLKDENINSDQYIEDGDASDIFWTDVIEEVENVTFAEINARTFNVIDNWLKDFLSNKYNVKFLTGSIEERIEQTKELIDSDLMLINPIFEYRGAIAQPIAFDAKTKTVIRHKYSKKTKLFDAINFYWDMSIISKNVAIQDAVLFLPANKSTYKKGEIDLVPVKSIHWTKTGKLPGEVSAKGKSTEMNIIDYLTDKTKTKMPFPDIDYAIDQIEKARNADFSIGQIERDLTGFDYNSERDAIYDKIDFKYAGWNGNVIRVKEILEYLESSSDDVFINTVTAKIAMIDSAKLLDEPKEIINIDKSKRVIWYDFEGYSLPFSPIDYVSPYNQVVFQVSVIETIDNVEVRKENIVIDPKTISLDDFVKIIEAVYSDGADAYVVYNKGYENTRIKEMVNALVQDGHPEAERMSEFFDVIVANTIDLYDLFAIPSKNKLPVVLMNDQKARASIKNVEKHITSNQIQVPRPIEQYSTLAVQNGMMAMETAIKRALGIIGDNEWNSWIESLKKYCENDVRAMIMVYDFVKMIDGNNE